MTWIASLKRQLTILVTVLGSAYCHDVTLQTRVNGGGAESSRRSDGVSFTS